MKRENFECFTFLPISFLEMSKKEDFWKVFFYFLEERKKVVGTGEKYSFLFSNDCVPFIEKTVLFFVHFQQQQQLQKKSSLRKISSDQDTQSRSSLYL